ncbi:MAG: FAD:protein FMN transferase [Acidobacteria bacterium]|nr:FAD:protein FMN transferase [Acidobacteriota bacterium]
MKLRTSVATLVVSALALGSGDGAEDVLHRQSRRIMGSLAEIQVYHADAPLAARAIAAALDDMQRVDELLSLYKPASELSRMNAQAAMQPFRASADLYAFVKQCRAYHDETRGTFDPTMGPIVRAWGFFAPRPAKPDDATAAAAKARSGFDKVRLDDASQSVSYTVEGVEFDPGGIGKGYAADRAVAVLRQHGITSALVSAGGSTLYGLGRPPGREGWKLAIRNPARPAMAVRYVMLRDSAISTSGASVKFVDIDGRRFGHIIDPRTGLPGEQICQVSLTAPTASDSDALAKAAYLLPREALEAMFASRAGVHVLRVEGRCDSAGAVWASPWSSGVFVEE